MSRAVGFALPAAGLAVGVVALALLVAPLPTRWLDVVVIVLFVAGAALALAGWRGGATPVRRLAVVALAWNALGLLLVAAAYIAG